MIEGKPYLAGDLPENLVVHPMTLLRKAFKEFKIDQRAVFLHFNEGEDELIFKVMYDSKILRVDHRIHDVAQLGNQLHLVFRAPSDVRRVVIGHTRFVNAWYSNAAW